MTLIIEVFPSRFHEYDKDTIIPDFWQSDFDWTAYSAECRDQDCTRIIRTLSEELSACNLRCSNLPHALAHLAMNLDVALDDENDMPDEEIYRNLTPTTFAACNLIVQFLEARLGRASLGKAPLKELQAIFMTLWLLLLLVELITRMTGQIVGVLRSG